VQPRRAHRISIHFCIAAESGSVFIAKRLAVLVLIAHRRFVLFLPPLGQRRRRPGITQAIETPDAGEVFWIEGRIFSLVFGVRLCPVLLILASRTSLPTRRRRYRRLCAIAVDASRLRRDLLDLLLLP